MKLKNIELWIAFSLIILIAVLYALFAFRAEVPAASGLIGHGLGVIGFILMVMTEVLYSLRKRYQFARWGKLQNWLSFHIITGIVGPFLVLLHTSWKFNGLAGLLTLLTLMIVASGFVGRYFYTALPRSPEGLLLESDQVQEMIGSVLTEIETWQERHPGSNAEVAELIRQATGSKKQVKIPRTKWLEIIKNEDNPVPLQELKALLVHQSRLQNQLRNLDRSRRLLAIWHTVHVPIGMAVFGLAVVHILAALYYATLLH